MKITISTPVEQDIITVWQGFNETLFTKLAPPFPPVKLLRFDGSEQGDEVHLELNFIFFKQKWVSRITENEKTDKEIFFIDEGIALPFFLKYWKHKHRIVKAVTMKTGIHTLIVDEIEFESPFGILLYPILFLQFLYRKPIYQKIFSNKT
jgi:ligand-binding SRPBCC domain-containing protein